MVVLEWFVFEGTVPLCGTLTYGTIHVIETEDEIDIDIMPTVDLQFINQANNLSRFIPKNSSEIK